MHKVHRYVPPWFIQTMLPFFHKAVRVFRAIFPLYLTSVAFFNVSLYFSRHSWKVKISLDFFQRSRLPLVPFPWVVVISLNDFIFHTPWYKNQPLELLEAVFVDFQLFSFFVFFVSLLTSSMISVSLS